MMKLVIVYDDRRAYASAVFSCSGNGCAAIKRWIFAAAKDRGNRTSLTQSLVLLQLTSRSMMYQLQRRLMGWILWLKRPRVGRLSRPNPSA